MKQYTMLIEYKGGNVVLLPGTQGKTHAVAREDNLYLLHQMGGKLLRENIIASYQIVELIGPAISDSQAAWTEEYLAELDTKKEPV